MATYVYGITDSNRTTAGPIAGLAGSPVQHLPYRDLGAAISDCPPRMPHATDEGVVRHEQVVEKLMEHATILPFRFLTVFSGKKDVLALMAERYDDFRRNLGNLRGKAEFSVKVIWPGDRIRERIIAATRNPALAPEPADSPARRFVKKRLAEHRIERALGDEADRRIALVHGFFAGFAAGSSMTKLRTSDLLLSAAYLVAKNKQQAFLRTFERLRSSPGDLKYLLSGPWPPYNFTDMARRRSRS